MREVSAFVCVGPLQSFIARKLIQAQRIGDYVLVNIYPHDKPVTRTYFARLAENAIESDFLVMDSRIFGNYLKVRRVARNWRKYRIVSLYLASVDTVFAQYIVRCHPSAALYTFDDGTVNVLPSSTYYRKAPLTMRQRVAYFLLRGHKDQNWIKPRIIKHFTIYQDMPNIVEAERLHYIDLFKSYDSLPNERMKKSIKVFLGYDHSPKYLSAVRTVDPDIYLPHPTEKRTEPWIHCVSTNLIAEDFLMQLLHDFESIELYACNSAALLNVRSPRIQKTVIDLYCGTSDTQREFNRLAELTGCRISSFPEAGAEVTARE